jgi:hypothetical protein
VRQHGAERGGAPFYRWFPDGVLNTCFNADDRHVRDGRADRVALVHDSPATGTTGRLTYAELLAPVQLFAGVETADDMATLRALDVPWGQGYHLARPAPLL